MHDDSRFSYDRTGTGEPRITRFETPAHCTSNLDKLAGTRALAIVTPLPIVNGSGNPRPVPAWVAPVPRTTAEGGEQ